MALHRPGDGVVLSGDAVLTVDLNSVVGVLTGGQRLAGPPRYTTWNARQARRSIGVLAGLRPRVLAAGHGKPVTAGTADALQALADRDSRWLRRLRPLAGAWSGTYRPPPRPYTRLQWLGFALTRLGLSPRYVVTLEVPGRRTGVIRRTNLVLTEHGGGRYLVSLTGESEWVRNVRAAGGRAVLARGGRRSAATLVEVPAGQRPAVLHAFLLRAGRRLGSPAATKEAQAYFGVAGDLRPDELAGVAHRHPVFRVVPAGR